MSALIGQDKRVIWSMMQPVFDMNWFKVVSLPGCEEDVFERMKEVWKGKNVPLWFRAHFWQSNSKKCWIRIWWHYFNKDESRPLEELKCCSWSKFKMPCRWETCLMISTKIFFLAGSGLGILKKPKYHYIVVGGLLVQELEPLKDLKAEKGWFFGQN